mmetsp:Transcript_17538/g.24484  ORF Transcript_17538/g.24484 Transcript_17538/m.24484 type:complete len:109 (+) Transcript_17538:172-498(+)
MRLAASPPVSLSLSLSLSLPDCTLGSVTYFHCQTTVSPLMYIIYSEMKWRYLANFSRSVPMRPMDTQNMQLKAMFTNLTGDQTSRYNPRHPFGEKGWKQPLMLRCVET